MGLDTGSLAYANLLMDPCNARLVHPVYAGSGSGYLTRFQKTFTLSNSNANGNIALLFTPGQVSNAPSGFAIPGSGLGSVQRVLYSTPGGYDYVYNDRDVQPGWSFMGSGGLQNVSARPVAACLKARYTGTELNRGGSVYTGYLPNSETFYSELPNATYGSVTQAFCSNLATASQFSSRVPDGHVEVKWSPSRGDMRFRDLGVESASTTSSPLHAGMFINFMGLPPTSTIEFTLTCVYEWMPNTSTGLVVPIETNRTNSSLDSVLSYLARFGNWMISNDPYARAIRAAGVSYLTGASGFTGGTRRIEL